MKKLQYVFMSLAAMLLATPAFAQGAANEHPENQWIPLAAALGMAIAAGLVALGGLVGGAGIRNPNREEIHAKNCPGGQLVGASSDIDWQELPDERAAPAPQPTGSPA